MTPYLTPDGWLRVPYSGPDIAVIEIRVTGTAWRPAYLDWDGGRRVAQVRCRGPLPASGCVRVNGEAVGSWGAQDAFTAPEREAPRPPGTAAGSSRDTSVT